MTARSQFLNIQSLSLLSNLAQRTETQAKKRLTGSTPIEDNSISEYFEMHILNHPVLRDALAIFAQSSNPGRPRALLAKSLAVDAATAFLRALLSLNFLPFGALAAQTEARHLQAILANLLPVEADQGIRPLFEPLTVALTLLNLETPADASAVPLSGVSKADLRLILSRRSDFAAAAINIAIDKTPNLISADDDNNDKLVYFKSYSS